MAFLTEPEPARGVALDVLPGIRRVVARNPSVMTYHGTNTYLLDDKDGLIVIDPGPHDDQHVQEVVAAAKGKPITRLILTHAHPDHHGAVETMREATGAPCWGYHTSGMPDFTADQTLGEGDEVAGLQAIYTPGHAPDHLCFAYRVPGLGQILFSGDHVMTWSSSIINPPHGNMLAYYRSLEKLLPREDAIYLPGHGPLDREPKELVQELLRHRQMREVAILEELKAGPASVGGIAERLYAKTDDALKAAAERNVLAHLLKLQEEGRVDQIGEEAVEEDLPPMVSPTDDRELLRAKWIARARRDAQRVFKAV
jgi:glyoxylase-like metal-dependent hydrolase (beta-lactamase superfamily II)